MSMESVARKLWDARQAGEIVVLDEDEKPGSTEEAYRIQAAQLPLWEAEPVGWKLGAGARAAMELLGVAAPFVAPLHPECHVADGGTVELHPPQGPMLETEFLVRLGSPLPHREHPYSHEEVAGAVAEVRPSFEIIAVRFAGGLAGNGRVGIGDNGMNQAVVEGPATGAWRDVDLGRHVVRVSRNGAEAGSGSFEPMIWDHPFEAVGWLAAHHALAGRGLRAGDMVMTGTVAGVIPLEPGDRVVADFGPMGSVWASFR